LKAKKEKYKEKTMYKITGYKKGKKEKKKRNYWNGC
jgi:hypothetical protein